MIGGVEVDVDELESSMLLKLGISRMYFKHLGQLSDVTITLVRWILLVLIKSKMCYSLQIPHSPT